MLSAGERPQPPVTPAVISSSQVSRNAAHIMPIESNSGSSAAPALDAHDSSQSIPTQHIWIVTGPAGCGKSTVGQALRKELGVSFLEGDDVWNNPVTFSAVGFKTKITNADMISTTVPP